jgi:DNA-binding MarR family transcriptional regulator/N-acetylglutamate synthase-like GNAT family acetyltransferase
MRYIQEMAMRDVMAGEGLVMLGSRLKRLAERLQAGADVVAKDCGMPVGPSHMPLLTALYREGELSIGGAAEYMGISQPAVTRLVGQLVALDLATTAADADDQRSRLIALTPKGRTMMDDAMVALWPRLEAAVREVGGDQALLDRIGWMEQALAAGPLGTRPGGGLRIRRFEDVLAADFARINTQWIEEMYEMEPTDVDLVTRPREMIVDPGGDILFVEHPRLGIIGTCGLMRVGARDFELIKMGVSPEARGYGAGELLLKATLARAHQLGFDRLFLLTNSKSAAAIRLYERVGFAHDAGVMEAYGDEYARCDVAMLWRG